MATSTKPKAQSLDEMRADLERKQAEFAEQQRRVEQEVAERNLRRERALREYDRQTVDAFDEKALDQAVKEAVERFRDAVLTGADWPEVSAAMVEANRAAGARSHMWGEYKGAVARLGLDAWKVTPRADMPTPMGNVASIAEVERLLSQKATNLVADLADAREQARVDAGEAAARG